MTLQELTNNESGIIVYGNEIITDNWSSYDDDQIPKAFGPMCVGFPVEPGAVERMQSTARRIDRVIDALPDVDFAVIVSDFNGDVPRIYSGEDDEPGTVYDLPDGGLLIVPDEWV